jgi:hypothetical protein
VKLTADCYFCVFLGLLTEVVAIAPVNCVEREDVVGLQWIRANLIYFMAAFKVLTAVLLKIWRPVTGPVRFICVCVCVCVSKGRSACIFRVKR